MFRNRVFVVLLSCFVLLAIVSPVEAGWPYASTAQSSNYIHEDTKTKNLDLFFFQSPFFPSFGDLAKVTTIVHRYPFNPRVLDEKKAKGTAMNEYTCISGQQNVNRNLGKKKDKFDAFGNAATTQKVSSSSNCDFFRAQTTFKGNQKQPAGSSVSVINSVQRMPPGVDPDCFDRDLLCLAEGRFKVKLDWSDFGGSGTATPIATGFGSGNFYFFNAGSSELQVQLLNRCKQNDHFWVFAAASTNVEFDLTVTDTVSGQSRVYGNELGNPAPAITDTSAFATCP